MKNIITIQHTQSVQHTNGMIGSWTDWELTGLGREQAENIGRNLSAELKGQAWKICSSDLARAKQTAQPLAGYMGIEIEYRDKLREIYFGEALGKTKQWARENRLPVNSIDDRSFPGAETWREFWNRIAGFCREIIAGEAENVIIVAHAGTLTIWQQLWLGEEIQMERFNPSGGVSFMRMDDNGQRTIQRRCDLSYMRKN